MKLIRLILLSSILGLFTGCDQSDQNSKKDIRFSDFEYDSITKTLKLNFDHINNLDIKNIEIITKKNLRQTLYLDSNKQIKSLYNSISLDRKKTFVDNTWYKFDARGNLDNDYTFYYTTGTLVSYDDKNYYLTYDFEGSLYGGEHYAIVGNYDEYFQLKKNSQIDTIRLDPNEPGLKIPVNTKYKKDGKYNIKFVVYEDKKSNDTIYRKRTYVDKDYFIENIK